MNFKARYLVQTIRTHGTRVFAGFAEDSASAEALEAHLVGLGMTVEVIDRALLSRASRASADAESSANPANTRVPCVRRVSVEVCVFSDSTVVGFQSLVYGRFQRVLAPTRRSSPRNSRSSVGTKLCYSFGPGNGTIQG